jgi:hypothetical protein
MTYRLAVVRAAWGAALLVAPDPALAWMTGARAPAPVVARAALRLLGARQLLQAGIAARWRGSTLGSDLGIATDGLHAVTALTVGLASRRWRRGALADALVAAGFAVAGRMVRPGRGG